jgi:hypothetical protein
MRPKQVIVYGASGILVVVLVLVAVLAYPILTSGTMRFLIPEDFRGLIVLKEGSNGQVPGDWLNVPEDGVVVVDSMRVFRDYYRINAKWENEEPVQKAIFGRDNDKYDEVMFWELPLPGTGDRFYFYVGRIDDLRGQWEEMRSDLYGVR